MLSIESLKSYSVYRDTVHDAENGLTVDLDILVSDGAACTDKTPLILYVIGSAMPRVGTDSDERILSDLLSRGYIVAVLDFLGDARSVTPELEWSIQRIRQRFAWEPEYVERVLAGTRCSNEAVYVLPSGYNIKRQLPFWAFDRHGVAGSFDFIVSTWNSDFLGVFQNKGIITHPDGRRETVREYTERLPGGKVTSVYQCIKRDGTPIDMNLYMDILYPTNPESDVPVMMYAQSSQHTVGTWNSYERPHLSGFLFAGYGVALFDFPYVPMARLDSWGYFDGDGRGVPGGVTGDNYTYSLGNQNNMRANAAAVRFLRYLSASEHETYRFNNERFGMIGISKTGNTMRLGHPNPDILHEERFFPGHHGETRYEIGETEGDGKGKDGGDIIRGGEPQPWLTAPDGSPISSRVQFVSSSVGSGEYAITDGYVPFYSCCTAGKGGSYWYFWPRVMSRAYTHDVPALGYFCPKVGHSFGVGPDRDTGVDSMVALFEMAHYYLKDGSPRCEYILPTSGSMIKPDARIEIRFNASIPEAEAERIALLDSRGESVAYTAIASYGRTCFELIPHKLRSGESYTVSVPGDLLSAEGRAIKAPMSASFIVLAEETEELALSARLDYDRPLSFAIPEGTRAVRFYVGNDAACAVLALDENGRQLARVPIGGVGTYELTLPEGTKGNLTLRTERKSGEYHVYSESFDNLGDELPRGISTPTTAKASPVRLYVTDELDRKGGGGSLKVADIEPDGRFLPYHSYYNGAQELVRICFADRFNDGDFGRRFQVSASVYDTAVRQLGFASGKLVCYDVESVPIDGKAYVSSYTTKPGEWTDHRFRLDLKIKEHLGSFEKNTLNLYAETLGGKNAECPVYLDEIKVHETVTDAMVTALTLVK